LQQRRRRRLFVLKAKVAAYSYCVIQLVNAGPGYVCVSKLKTIRGGREGERVSAIYLAVDAV